MASSVNFIDFPNEVKLKVLSNLPVREIQRARSICKHVRDLVDNTQNAGLLVGESQRRCIGKLQELVDVAFNCEECDLFEACIRYVRCSGLGTDPHSLNRWALTFGRRAAGRKHALVLEDYLVMGFQTQGRFFEKIFNGLMSAHWYRPHSLIDVDELSLQELTGLEDTFVEDITRAAGWLESSAELAVSESELRRWHKKIHEIPKGELVWHWAPDTRTGERWTLTPKDNSHGCWGLCEQNVCSSEALTGLLGVPSLPPHNAHVYAYGVETEWAYNKVQEAISGAQLSPLMKMALLEEIHFN